MGFILKAIGSFFANIVNKYLEIERAKKSGMNEQAAKNQETANEELEKWSEIDNSNESDSDAIDRLSSWGKRK